MENNWAEIRKEIQAERRKRREEFAHLYDLGYLPGWTQHIETHYSYELCGDRLDYWPGTKSWRWRHKTCSGDVFSFIASREKKHAEDERNHPGTTGNREDHNTHRHS